MDFEPRTLSRPGKCSPPRPPGGTTILGHCGEWALRREMRGSGANQVCDSYLGKPGGSSAPCFPLCAPCQCSFSPSLLSPPVSLGPPDPLHSQVPLPSRALALQASGLSPPLHPTILLLCHHLAYSGDCPVSTPQLRLAAPWEHIVRQKVIITWY